MHNILLTGVTTLDIINHVEHYPCEDSEVRAVQQQIRSGGNTCNSAIVIQQLGIRPVLLANFADDNSAAQILSQLKSRNIDTSLCPVQQNSRTPTSYITINRQNGSRSIIHHRQLDELQAEYMKTIDLSAFSWLHFEARNCSQLKSMLPYARSFNIPVSIELEKPRKNMGNIPEFADVLLISKVYAESQQLLSAEDCINYYRKKYPDKTISCTWGSQGAWAYHKSHVIHQPAFKLQRPVETLGAGDTFNAAFIASQLHQLNITDSLKFACRLAANKCMQSGFDQLRIPP